MASPDTEADDNDGEEGAEEGAAKKGKGKLIFIIAGVILLGVVGVGASMVMGGDDGKSEETHAEDGTEEGKTAKVGTPVYYELPEFLVNLSGTGTRVSFLKMSVTLELRDQTAVALVEANKPRIIDTFNTYLREMRPGDLAGSAGIYRLRDELMTRMNKTIEEGLVKDILFSEIIVQ